MNNQEELRNAIQGLTEQVKYITWLCDQLGYIAPDTYLINPEEENVEL